MSHRVGNVGDSEADALRVRARGIMEELRQGVKKRFTEVIDVSRVDQHKGGVKPLSFVRQVLAACLYPQLLSGDGMPADARERAMRLLAECDGGSVGSYTETGGIPSIKNAVSKFISQRDGGVPSNPDNIFFASGSQGAIMIVLNMLVNRESSPPTAVLTPVPSCSSANRALEMWGGVAAPYYLSEERGWEPRAEELRRALHSARGVCNPVALYVVNPGNPTGHVQSRTSIEEVIKFASEERLFLMADEVYQDAVFAEGCRFVSYKRVLAEMGPPVSNTLQMASLHSASKGFMGECGLRGGYVELVNVDPDVLKHFYMLFATESCSPVTGQIALDLMVDPPHPGDPSYLLHRQEIQHIREMMERNVKRVPEVLNGLPGLSCQPVHGGAFAFPKLQLPPGAVQRATEGGLLPDAFYCSRLLEEAGLCVCPGGDVGQREGTFHLRLCIMTAPEAMEEILRRLSAFHVQFMEDFC